MATAIATVISSNNNDCDSDGNSDCDSDSKGSRNSKGKGDCENDSDSDSNGWRHGSVSSDSDGDSDGLQIRRIWCDGWLSLTKNHRLAMLDRISEVRS